MTWLTWREFCLIPRGDCADYTYVHIVAHLFLIHFQIFLMRTQFDATLNNFLPQQKETYLWAMYAYSAKPIQTTDSHSECLAEFEPGV